VASFVRPQGIEAPSTPILVSALERLATAATTEASVSPALYPLSAVLWAAGSIAVYKEPHRLKGLLYKQYRITGKRVQNMIMRRRKAERVRERDAREEMLRRKAG
jgi:hypothetical protein